ncbi:MAG: hypothetical protein FJ014_04230 [Chloroflexi bacterium]|nr:hypothetical protein [Chloroflexota bacterium]
MSKSLSENRSGGASSPRPTARTPSDSRRAVNKRKIAVLTVALLCGLLVVGGGVWALASASHAINWDVIGGGGGSISSASYAVNSTVGQPAIGPSGSANYRLGAGYWYVVAVPTPPPEYKVHLPIVVKKRYP